MHERHITRFAESLNSRAAPPPATRYEQRLRRARLPAISLRYCHFATLDDARCRCYAILPDVIDAAAAMPRLRFIQLMISSMPCYCHYVAISAFATTTSDALYSPSCSHAS